MENPLQRSLYEAYGLSVSQSVSQSNRDGKGVKGTDTSTKYTHKENNSCWVFFCDIIRARKRDEGDEAMKREEKAKPNSVCLPVCLPVCLSVQYIKAEEQNCDAESFFKVYRSKATEKAVEE